MDINNITEFVEYGFPITHTLGLFGNHGIGKTSFVANTIREIVARKHSMPVERVHVISRCVSIMDPADLIGNFQEFGGRTYSCPPSWIPVEKKYDDMMVGIYEANGKTYTRLTNYDDIYILFLDECKRGNSIIQDAIMELLLEHKLFGVNLHPMTYVICADNDNMSIYNGTRRDPAQESRIKNVTFAPTNKEYLADYARRVTSGLIHPVIHEYLSKYPEYIVLPTKTIEDLSIKGQKGPCPRDWTQLGECLRDFASNGHDIVSKPGTMLLQVAAAYIGSSYAAKFNEFCTNERSMNIDANTIINKFSPVIAKQVEVAFSGSPSLAVPIVSSLADTIVGMGKALTTKQGNNVFEFLKIASVSSEAIASLVQHWTANARSTFDAWRCTPARHKLCNAAIINTTKDDTGVSKYDKWVTSFCKLHGISPDDLDRDDIKVGVK